MAKRQPLKHPFPISQFEAVYRTLIMESWSNSETFEVYQESWKAIAEKFGIEGDNMGKLKFKEAGES